MPASRCAVWLLAALLGTLGCSACGGHRCEDHDGECRAGYPSQLSPLARPTDTGKYTGYLVGGGAPGKKGEAPCPDEGTWGWDYLGRCLPSRVILGWYHGRDQGGSGSYEPDGPRLHKHEKGHEGEGGHEE